MIKIHSVLPTWQQCLSGIGNEQQNKNFVGLCVVLGLAHRWRAERLDWQFLSAPPLPPRPLSSKKTLQDELIGLIVTKINEISIYYYYLFMKETYLIGIVI